MVRFLVSEAIISNVVINIRSWSTPGHPSGDPPCRLTRVCQISLAWHHSDSIKGQHRQKEPPEDSFIITGCLGLRNIAPRWSYTGTVWWLSCRTWFSRSSSGCSFCALWPGVERLSRDMGITLEAYPSCMAARNTRYQCTRGKYPKAVTLFISFMANFDMLGSSHQRNRSFPSYCCTLDHSVVQQT